MVTDLLQAIGLIPAVAAVVPTDRVNERLPGPRDTSALARQNFPCRDPSHTAQGLQPLLAQGLGILQGKDPRARRRALTARTDSPLSSIRTLRNLLCDIVKNHRDQLAELPKKQVGHFPHLGVSRPGTAQPEEAGATPAGWRSSPPLSLGWWAELTGLPEGCSRHPA